MTADRRVGSAWVRRASFAGLVVCGGMALLSTLCLCIAGQMVSYFLVAAAAALIAFGYDRRRARRLAGLTVVAANLALADSDHAAGMGWYRHRVDRLLTQIGRSEGSTTRSNRQE